MENLERLIKSHTPKETAVMTNKRHVVPGLNLRTERFINEKLVNLNKVGILANSNVLMLVSYMVV